MPQSYDVVVIGGGHNGLVNAAYLAKAGKKVLVLERRGVLGGAAVTEENRPGLPLLRMFLCRFTFTSRNHSRTESAPLRPRNPPARRHLFPHAQR